ncbi:type VI secretion system protein TssA [Aeromonas schubertii]|uniref:type VI secretion system protein TssA n=1 Tax=Aeromonas TaxID=642 RepID=UPI00067E7BE5|nr:type VI secretion system protein TssA [Aeromonas schubertii]KUE81867.1 type VI secretion protein [Aeromonas schubertii]MBZ6074642.1 type VI secretion system protein TssA [Aeromonas schubertii]
MAHAHPWCQRLLAPLPEAAVSAAVAADDPLWESVETELVKLGSLAHSQVDLGKVSGDCLTLLESRTKDMRVLAQLLRCLQHPAKATPFATALMLLDAWVEAYWDKAFPASALQKQRVLSQIIKRFEGVLGRVCEQGSAAELRQLLTLAEGFEQRWLTMAPDKEALLGELVMTLRRAQRRQEEQAKVDAAPVAAPVVSAATGGGSGAQIDASSERAWRQSQLKVAELLIEQQPEAPIGYRLRRNAIWSTITAPPMASKGNKTPLAPMSADMVEEYRAALAQPDAALWGRIEQSLTLAPYWFEGHQLSAMVATRLGQGAVAEAIREELAAFIERLPALRELAFSDGTPFLSAECGQWLQPGSAAQGEGHTSLQGELTSCCQGQGLAAALALLDERLGRIKEPRERFYGQLAGAELLAGEGMKSLAAQHYQHLWQEAVRLGLAQWEPGLVSRLERHATSRSS